MKNLDNNTVSKISTNFLRGVELVNEAIEKYGIANENWAYPYMRFGDSDFDDYYAEIWDNGMDYNLVLWLIERNSCDDPEVYPLLIIDGDERQKFNDYDFKKLLQYIVYCRRNIKWVKHKVDDWKYKFEHVYAYLKENSVQYSDDKKYMIQFEFEHNSQEKVIFYINKKMITF